jgi:hypothetical protein
MHVQSADTTALSWDSWPSNDTSGVGSWKASWQRDTDHWTKHEPQNQHNGVGVQRHEPPEDASTHSWPRDFSRYRRSNHYPTTTSPLSRHYHCPTHPYHALFPTISIRDPLTTPPRSRNYPATISPIFRHYPPPQAVAITPPVYQLYAHAHHKSNRRSIFALSE